jgi:hypothetical protein
MLAQGNIASVSCHATLVSHPDDSCRSLLTYQVAQAKRMANAAAKCGRHLADLHPIFTELI